MWLHGEVCERRAEDCLWPPNRGPRLHCWSPEHKRSFKRNWNCAVQLLSKLKVRFFFWKKKILHIVPPLDSVIWEKKSPRTQIEGFTDLLLHNVSTTQLDWEGGEIRRDCYRPRCEQILKTASVNG